MAINALEIGLFDNLVRGSSKAIKTPEQVAAELKFHIQKEIDAQFLQNQFTANDIPPIDSFQRQNQPDDDDPNNPKKKPTQPLPALPIGVPPKIKQWLG